MAKDTKLLNVEWWCRLGLSDLVKRSWKEVFKKAIKSWVVWWWIGSKFQSKDLLTPSSYAGSGQQQARHWQQQSLCRLCRSIVEHPATSCWEGWRQEEDTGATLQELIPTVSLPFSHPLSLLLFLALLTCSSWASKCQETSSALGMPELQAGGGHSRSEHSSSTGLSRSMLIPYHPHSVILGDKTLGWMVLSCVPGGSLLCCTTCEVFVTSDLQLCKCFVPPA